MLLGVACVGAGLIIGMPKYTYASENDGTMSVANTYTGWEKNDDGTWSYYQNGEMVCEQAIKVGDSYYVFNSKGKMVCDSKYSIWNGSSYDRYYASKDGTLYKNKWIQKNNIWYYACEDYKLASGLKNIGGISYLFDYYAELVKSKAVNINGASYASDSKGVGVKLNNGWTLVGEYWYYASDNRHIYGDIINISNKYYYFNDKGQLSINSQYRYYNYITFEEFYCRSREDGTLYRNAWYQDYDGEWYYYGDKCDKLSGVQNINGKLYYLTDDGIYTNRAVSEDGICYCADKDGVLRILEDNKWVYVDGYWYYAYNGEIPYKKIVSIDGKCYGFDSQGRMCAGGSFGAYDQNDVWKYYRAKEDGTLCKNEWYNAKAGWEYYDSNCVALNGLQTIGGKKYYFSSRVLKETGYASAGSKKYLIVDNSVVLTDNQGWYNYNGEWYYMKSDGSLYQGLLTLGNNKYYMGYEMYHNSRYVLSSNILYQATDATGVLTKITKDGLYTDEKNTYCIYNGKPFTGWKLMEDGWRYFEYGYMLTYTKEDIDGKYYVFDGNGVMYSNTWVGTSIYATASGACATGEYTIDGKTYYFSSDGYLDESKHKENKQFIVDGKIYTLSEGWNNINGDWYYVRAGEFVEKAQNIDGKLYYFKDNVMLVNQNQWDVFYGKDGAAIKGWYNCDGLWMYADDNYTLAKGVTRINGVKYYFINGCLADEDVLVGIVKHAIGIDGIVKDISKVQEGWNYIGHKAYYFKDDKKYTGWLGNAFIKNGEKCFETKVYDRDAEYYINKNGDCVYSAWIHLDENNYYYAGADGKLKCKEWSYINGAWYYFDENCFMYTGVLENNGKTYYLDRNGKLIKTYSAVTSGWHQIDGNWLYGYNGQFVSDCTLYIGGYFYHFGSDGIMDVNVFEKHAYDANGAMITSMGWHKLDNQWLYLNSQGYCIWGEWLNIGGHKYYINGTMYTGYNVVDNELYYFDSEGACKGKVGVSNGWYNAGTDWYYFIDGKVVVDQILTIKGEKYAFGLDGKMLTNVVRYTEGPDYIYRLYYFGSNGVAVQKEGIYTTADGKKVYVAEDGEAYIGAVYINGKIQYMDAICD